jgi:hypothetical protein
MRLLLLSQVSVLFCVTMIRYIAGSQTVGAVSTPQTHKTGEVVPPKLLSTDKFPLDAACKGLEPGSFWVDFTVGEDGSPSDLDMRHVPRVYRVCATQLVSHLRYVPAKRDGAPIKISIHWRLDLSAQSAGPALKRR